ncbi:tRNA (guanine-N7)-methyltransferase, partial [bacterium]|nr:tRNA (guanine-N7)-methyltransferase [bacterium]
KQYYLILRKAHELELKTDNLDFFNYSIQSINDSKLFEVIYKTNDLYSELTNTYNLNNVATEYEQKFHNQGHLINKLIAKSLKKK